MKQYDVTCPVCGTLNKGLFLEETDGWMECVHCHTKTKDLRFLPPETVRFPVITMDQPIPHETRQRVSPQK